MCKFILLTNISTLAQILSQEMGSMDDQRPSRTKQMKATIPSYLSWAQLPKFTH
ncbi:hypothetical protein M758_3G199500 [Ceratodon purpureus]|nr:hypothetical protein M758_3G199500 [Ceratodon purpureus]